MANRNKKARRAQKKKQAAQVAQRRAGRASENGVDQTIRTALAHHGAGNLAAAQSLYQKVLESNPNQPDALHLSGVIAQQIGQNDLAVDLIARSIIARPEFAEAHSNLGVALQALGRLEDAAASYSNALAVRPEYAEAHNNLGITLRSLGRLDEAVESYQQAIALNPDYVEAHSNLGASLRALGRLDEALVSYERALALKPNHTEAHYNLGNTYRQLGRYEEAAACFKKTVELRPNHAEACCNLGLAQHGLGHWEDAVASYQRALEIRPEYADVHNNLGITLHKLRRLEEAAASYRRAIDINPDHAEAHGNLGHTLQHLGQVEDAVECFRQAVELQPDFAAAHSQMGNALLELGRVDESIVCYEEALRLRPNFADALAGLAHLYERINQLEKSEQYARQALEANPNQRGALITTAILLRRDGQNDEAREILESLPLDELPGEKAARAYFELGKLYDLAHDSERAFESFTKGNQLQCKRRVGPSRADNFVRIVEGTLQLMTPEFVARWPKANDRTDVEPVVFLVGFPRSGTTLLDQILDAHPKLQVMEEKLALATVAARLHVMPGGYPQVFTSLKSDELLKMREHYFRTVDGFIKRQPGTMLVDKFPLNILHLPLAALMFPGAKVLLVLRHPCDVVLSNFMQLYQLNAAMANFQSIESAARLYELMMSLWQKCAELLPLDIAQVRYEDLVVDVAGESRRLLEFLDVGWQESVLEFHTHAKGRGRIGTPSYEQVTQPIYQRAKYRWKRYEKQLEPVMEQLQPFIEAFGYAGDIAHQANSNAAGAPKPIASMLRPPELGPPTTPETWNPPTGI